MTGDEELAVRLAEVLNGTSHLGCEEFDASDPDSDCPDCGDIFRAARVLLPVVRRYGDQRAAEALRYFADLIDRGPTFPLPPGIFSAMARERANDLRGAGE